MIIGAIFVGIGSAILIAAVCELFEAGASKRWQSTSGVIMASSIETGHDTEGGEMFRPRISYRYRVNEVEFVASRIYFGSRVWRTLWSPVEREARRYPVGSEVVIWFDPSDPGEAALDRRVSWRAWSELAVAVVFVAMGLLAIGDA